MTSKADFEWNRKMAAHLFNSTWVLLEKKARSKEESDTMIHMAHASRYHWGVVGGPKELAIDRIKAKGWRPRKTSEASVRAAAKDASAAVRKPKRGT